MKWLWRILLVLMLMLGGALAWVWVHTESRLARRHDILVQVPELPAGREALAEGARIAQVRGCMECHGEDLAGKLLIPGGPGRISAANLTRGVGGIAAGYGDADWVRAIRHAVGPGGRALWLMPSEDNVNISQADLGKLIAFLKQVPAVDRPAPQQSLSLLGRVLFAFDLLPLLQAERIDHATPPAPDAIDDPDRGRYLAQICTGCHGRTLEGGRIAGLPPDFPPAADLTGGSKVADYTEAQFASAVRAGRAADGRSIDPRHMPWVAFAAMTDKEISQLHGYLQTLP